MASYGFASATRGSPMSPSSDLLTISLPIPGGGAFSAPRPASTWCERSCEDRTRTPKTRPRRPKDPHNEAGELPAQPDRMPYAGMSGTWETHVEGDG